MANTLDRYHRQMLLPAIGSAGQARLAGAHAFIAGCGALGCAVADTLARAGVGRLTIVDRDIVELTNLQRQVLYTEEDATQGIPKAIAAKARLQAVNSTIEINAVVADINPGTIEGILESQIDVIVDGLDNFETRYLLNDAAVKYGIPYVYGGAVSTNGMTMTILPHQPAHIDWPKTHWMNKSISDAPIASTVCLRCVFPEAPPPGSTPTCDTAGVLGPIVTMVASMEAAETLKILVGEFRAVNRQLVMFDAWTNEHRRLNISESVADDDDANDCPCCGQGKFDYLTGQHAGSATSLCGRNAVQVLPTPKDAVAFNYDAVADRLVNDFAGTRNRFMLKAHLSEGDTTFELTLFPDGRAVIAGTDDPAIARSVYARYVGV